jgi:hypothetical protein
MRIEVISKSFGKDLGLTVGGDIADDKFFSSIMEPTDLSAATNARLNSAVAWKPEAQDDSQFVEIDLTTPHQISAVVLQGAEDDYVTSYRLELSKNGADWWAHSEDSYVKVFDGVAVANNTVASAVLADCVARYVRVCPMSWNNAIAMRVEIMGTEEAGFGGQSKTLLSIVGEEQVDADFGNAADESDDEDFTNPWGNILQSTGDMESLQEDGNFSFVNQRAHRRMSGTYGFDEDGESFGFGA